MEGQVRRPPGQRCAETAALRRRERQIEAGGGRPYLGQRGAQGPARKKMVEPAAKKAAVDHLVREHQMSERRACRLLDLHRATKRYRTKRQNGDTLRQRLGELARQRQSFGYRRLTALLRREGQQVNHKRVYRLYRELGLALHSKRRRRISRVT